MPSDARVTGYIGGRVTLRSNVIQRIKGVIKDGGWKRIYPGDLAISGMNAHLGAIGVSDSLGKCSPIYLVLIPKVSTNAQYVGYALRHAAHVGAVKSFVNTIRFNSSDFKRDALKLFRLPIPEPAERAAIVRFLDHANRRIERFIRAKRKLIALLNEQKQAIIHRAVTRGLDPNVPLKDSGVPWLGQIPAHWDLVPNRALMELRKEVVGKKSSAYTLLSLTLRGVVARNMDDPSGKWPASFDTYQAVKPGNLVFCLFDIDETPRFVGLSQLAGMITGAYTVFACKRPDFAEWAYAFYLAMDFDKRLKPAYTGLRKVIPKGAFLGLKLPMPPINERTAILEHAKQATSNVGTAIAQLNHEIALAQELRARLISDVVTGQLEVREAAAHLPDDESLASDDAEPAADEDATDEDDAA